MIKKLATSILDQCLKLKCFQDYINGRITQNYLGQRFCVDDISQLSNIYSVQEYHIDDIRKDDVVLDIGANIGAFALPVSTKCKLVVAVEPLYYRLLIYNREINNIPNIRVLPAGLGSTSYTRIKYGKKEEICSMYKFSQIKEMLQYKPTFLKIDCEGAEWTLKPEDLEGIRRIEGELHLGTENFFGKLSLGFDHTLGDIQCLFKDYNYTLENHGNTVIIHATRIE